MAWWTGTAGADARGRDGTVSEKIDVTTSAPGMCRHYAVKLQSNAVSSRQHMPVLVSTVFSVLPPLAL